MKVEREKRGLSESEDKNRNPDKDKKEIGNTPVTPKPTEQPAKQKAAIGRESVPHSPSEIPAFHELKKAPERKQNAPVIPHTDIEKIVVNKKPTTLRTDIDANATVITDTKSNRFKLGPSIITSIKSWFKQIATPKRKKVPTYTIPEASRRKGVIQKATSKTGTVFTADSGTLKEQIRLRRIEEANRRKLLAESAAYEPETTWSPFTDVGYNLLDAPSPQRQKDLDTTENVNVVFKKRTVKIPVPPPVTEVVSEEIPPVVEVVPEEIPVPPPVVEVVPEEIPVPPPVVEVVPEEIPVPPPVVEVVPEAVVIPEPPVLPVMQITPEEEPAPTPISTPVESATKTEVDQAPAVESEPIIETPEFPEELLLEEDDFVEPRERNQGMETNALAMIILGSVVAIVLILLVGRVFVQYIDDTFIAEDTNIAAATALLDTAVLTKLTLTQENVNQLPSQIINRTVDTNNQLTEFVVVSQNGAVISPSNIFSTLGFTVMSSLHRSLTDIRFLSTNTTNELLLIKFIDETTVRGGLLFWEQNLASDMSTVFALPTTLTSTYSDVTISGVDVRILKSEGDVVLLYGIIDENTALIATSEAAFASVIAAEFSN